MQQKESLYVSRERIDEMKSKMWTLEKSQTQTAIVELEKVKTELNQEIDNANVLLDPVEYEDYHELLGVIRGYKLSVDQIDQQIKSLKGEEQHGSNKL